MGVRVRQRDRRVGLPRHGKGRVIHTRDPHAERDREGRLLAGERQLVQDDALQIALAFRGAGQVDELALPM